MNYVDEVLERAEVIDLGEPWFKILRLPNDVYSICEPKHQHEVISFLIVGSRKSVLLDTGMGIRDISNIVCQLTSLEVMVVNTHAHFDHVGDNHRFSHIHIYDDALAVNRLMKGWSFEELRYDVSLNAFREGYPEGFDPQIYAIQPLRRENINLLHDGDVIDLGDRTLQVLHTPGHTQDSISLLDHMNKSLFTGDTFYPDWLFAFVNDAWGCSDLEDYTRTIKRLTRLVPDLNYLYCSHVKPLAEPQILRHVDRAFEKIKKKDDVDYELIEMYGQELKLFQFDGFAIVTGNQ